MFVIVIGGGKVGYHLTRTLLTEGYEVVLVEKDRKRFESLVEELGEVITRGDGCETRVMQEVGMARADCVVAATGHDEDNFIICQVAKRKFEVPRTIARVNNPKNEEIMQLLGVDRTVNSTRIIYSLIEQEVEVGEMMPLTALNRGKVEIIAAEVDTTSPVAGRPMKDIRLPGESVVAAVIRNDQILLPSGTTTFEVGDTLIALAHPEEEPALRACLCGGRNAASRTQRREQPAVSGAREEGARR